MCNMFHSSHSLQAHLEIPHQQTSTFVLIGSSPEKVPGNRIVETVVSLGRYQWFRGPTSCMSRGRKAEASGNEWHEANMRAPSLQLRCQ